MQNTRIYTDIGHTSDHHPLLLVIRENQIPWTRTEVIVPEAYTIKRIKQRVTTDMVQLLQDRLSEEVRTDIEELHSLIKTALTTDTDGETSKIGIDQIAGTLDLLLQKAWGITLDTIGEEITVEPAAPRGRTTQTG